MISPSAPQFFIFCYIVVYELFMREGYKLTVVPDGYVRLQTDYNVKTLPEIGAMAYCTQSPTVYAGVAVTHPPPHPRGVL